MCKCVIVSHSAPLCRVTVRPTHQSPDAAVLPHGPARSPEPRHVGDGLGCQALQLFIGGVQDGHHGLEPAQIGDGSSDLRAVTDLLQDLQRADLRHKKGHVQDNEA